MFASLSATNLMKMNIISPQNVKTKTDAHSVVTTNQPVTSLHNHWSLWWVVQIFLYSLFKYSTEPFSLDHFLWYSWCKRLIMVFFFWKLRKIKKSWFKLARTFYVIQLYTLYNSFWPANISDIFHYIIKRVAYNLNLYKTTFCKQFIYLMSQFMTFCKLFKSSPIM